MINLANTLQAAAQGPLTLLDLSDSFSEAQNGFDDPHQGPKVAVHTANNQAVIERQAWDITLNRQGKYEKTWKLLFPSDATGIRVDNLFPLLEGKLGLQGVYSTKGEGKQYSWIMCFNREGDCIMDWKPPVTSSITSCCFLANSLWAVVMNRSDLQFLNNDGKLLTSWKSPASHYNATSNIVKVFGLSDHQLAVHVIETTQGQSQHSIVFLNNERKVLNSWKSYGTSEIRSVYKLSEHQLAVHVIATAQGQQSQHSIVFLNSQGECLKSWTPDTSYNIGNSIQSIDPVSNDLVVRLYKSGGCSLILLNCNGELSSTWQPSLEYGISRRDIAQIYFLSHHKLAVHLYNYCGDNPGDDSIVFLNDGLQCLYTFSPKEGRIAISDISLLHQDQTAITFSRHNPHAVRCYLLNRMGFPLKQKSFSSSPELSRKVLRVTEDKILLKESVYTHGHWESKSIEYSWESCTERILSESECNILQTTDGQLKRAMSSDGHLFTYWNAEVTNKYDYRSFGCIQPANFPNLWEVLAKHPTITECRFQGLPIKDEGACGIAQMLRENATITKIDLTGTEITDKGARQLLSVLKANRSVIVVLLRGNPIHSCLIERIECRLSQHARQPPQVFASPDVSSLGIPPELYCSLTHLVMADPVFTEEGDTYEREAIEQWLQNHDTCPNTNVRLSSKVLIPNKAVKKQLVTLHEKYPTLLYSGEVYFPKCLQADCLDAAKKSDIETVKRCVEQDARLLILPLVPMYEIENTGCKYTVQRSKEQPDMSKDVQVTETTETLLSCVLRFGPVSLLQWVVKKIGDNQFRKLAAETIDGEAEFFKQAARNFGKEGGWCIGQALGWNHADYEDQLFQAMAEKDLQLLDVCASLTPLDGLDEQGNSPLHVAVLAQSKPLIESLIRHHAKVKVENLDGRTPKALARFLNRKDLSDYIAIQRRAVKLAPILQPLQEQLILQQQEIEKLKQENQRLADLFLSCSSTNPSEI